MKKNIARIAFVAAAAAALALPASSASAEEVCHRPNTFIEICLPPSSG